jgi:hypothetical protein
MRIQELLAITGCCLIVANTVSRDCLEIGRGLQPGITSKTLQQDQAAVDKTTDPRQCLDETDSDVDWNESGDPPIVRIMLEYKNTCKRPVSCKVIVESGRRPSSASKNDYSEWEMRDTLNFKFTISGMETRKFLGTLWWFKTTATTPGVRRPNLILKRNLEFMECSFADTKPPERDG